MPTLDEIAENEAQRRYVEAVQRGETGSRLARSAGIAAPQGFSPPIITPQAVEPPPLSLDSAANYVRYPQGMGGDWDAFEQGMANVPIDQAQKAIDAAMRYQSMRGFQRDLDSGMSPAEAAMKWAPGLNRSTLSGIASLTKATRTPEQPGYEFVPGDVKTGRPAAWVPAGGTGRPLSISRSQLTLPPEEIKDIVKEEVVPGSGIYVAYRPGEKMFKVINAKAQGLSPEQQFQQRKKIMEDIPKYQERLKFMNPEDPAYESTTELIQALQDKLKEIKAPTISPSPVAKPSPVAEAVPAPQVQPSPFREGQRIRSKKDPSKVYIIRNGKPVLVEE